MRGDDEYELKGAVRGLKHSIERVDQLDRVGLVDFDLE